jgi:hypothetical protein
MTKGKASPIGATYIADNGYHYIKTESGWRLAHHLVAEGKYRRPVLKGDRVVFKDKDKNNLSPNNIVIVKKTTRSTARRAAQLRARIQELQAQLEELEAEDG